MAHKTEHLKLSIFMFMVDFVNKLSNTRGMIGHLTYHSEQKKMINTTC